MKTLIICAPIFMFATRLLLQDATNVSELNVKASKTQDSDLPQAFLLCSQSIVLFFSNGIFLLGSVMFS